MSLFIVMMVKFDNRLFSIVDCLEFLIRFKQLLTRSHVADDTGIVTMIRNICVR